MKMKGHTLSCALLFVAVTALNVSGDDILSSWMMRADMAGVRHGHCAAAVGGYVYVMGGVPNSAAPSDAMNSVERYDPATDTWEQRASMPTARHSLGCAVLDGYIYAIGGHVANSRSENERYDPSRDTWERRASMPTARSGPGVAAFGGKIYVFGGNHYGSYTSIIEAYDPNTDTWTTVGDMPASVEPWRAVTLGDKIYMPKSASTSEFWAFEPTTGQWETLPNMNVARFAPELVAVGKYLFAIGGGGSAEATVSVEWWTPGAAAWTLGSHLLNGARSQFGAAAVGNTIYLAGGWSPAAVAMSSTESASLLPRGVIVFTSVQSGNHDIWAINADGTGLIQLTDSPDVDFVAKWSPDSSKVLYGKPDRSQIWSLDWATKTHTKIYDAHDYNGQDRGSWNVWRPSLSPDGTTIVFEEHFSYNNPHIMKIGIDGQDLAEVPVEAGYVTGPSWSPDGKAFVYTRRNSGLSYSPDLWIYDFADANPGDGIEDILQGTNHRLTQGANSPSTLKQEPDWQPSGKILFNYGGNLALINPGVSPNWGDPANPLIQFLTTDGSSDTHRCPSWSPDLSQIVFQYHRDGVTQGLYDIYTIGADGTGRQVLYEGPSADTYPDWGDPVVQAGVSVEAPDGQSGQPGETLTYEFTITNYQDQDDTFDLAAVSEHGWEIVTVSPSPVEVTSGSTATVQVQIEIPGSAVEGDTDVLTLTATSQSDNSISDSASVITTVIESTISVTLDIGEVWGAPGSTVEVPVMFTNHTTPAATGLQVDILYEDDETKLKADEPYVRNGPAADDAGKSCTASVISPGRLRVVCAGLNTTTIGDGVLFYLLFETKQNAEPGTVFPLGGEDLQVTDKDANLVPGELLPGSITVGCSTDINGDGDCNIQDVQLVINAVLGYDISPFCADVNSDGDVNIQDVQTVINCVLGL